MIEFAKYYLKAAEVSFLKQAGKSKTPLNIEKGSKFLQTRALTKKDDRLCLNLEYFTLEWRRKGRIINNLLLDRTVHFENIRWIEEMSIYACIKNAYDFENCLLETIIPSDFIFCKMSENFSEDVKDHRELYLRFINSKKINNLNQAV